MTDPEKPSKIGVLLLNLGTPDGTDYTSMRRYLKQFLSDRRVIEMPRWKWWPILNLIILNRRPQKSGALYDKIWDRQANDSPLRVTAISQVENLTARLDDKRILVDYAMRYGSPSIASQLAALKKKGCEKILLVPLFPQYSGPTTASGNDAVFDALKAMRWQPTIRMAPPYFDNPNYITALADSVREGIETLDFVPDQLVVSFHGMPKSYIDAGDPYQTQCIKTARLLRTELGWSKDRLFVAYQSRFGREEWLQPYLDEALANMPKTGTRNIAIIAPAFSVDCLETLEELAIAARELFLEAGGENFAYIPCLNASDGGMNVIENIVRKELLGWWQA